MNNEKKRRKSISLIIILSILSFVVISLLIFIIVLIYMFFSERQSENNNEITSAKFIEITPSLNTTVGFCHSYLHENEYLSYKNEESGNFIYITPFGGESYECTGNCYCDENNNIERRIFGSSTTTLSRGLMMTLSALTLLSAINMAKEIFQSKCVDDFTGICDPSRIYSDIDECSVAFSKEEFEELMGEAKKLDEEIITGDELMALRDREKQNKDKVDGKKLLEMYQKGTKDYVCNGHCEAEQSFKFRGLSNEDYTPLNKFMVGKISEKKIDCNALEFQGNIKLFNALIPESFDLLNPSTQGTLRKYAKIRFIESQLTPFCKEMSMVSMDGWDGFSSNMKKQFPKNEVNACSGESLDQPQFSNNVDCELVQ